MVTYIECQCGKRVRKQGINRHVDSRHRKDAYINFTQNYFNKLANGINECSKCDKSGNPSVFISEEQCFDHIRNFHLKQAVRDYSNSLKGY